MLQAGKKAAPQAGNTFNLLDSAGEDGEPFAAPHRTPAAAAQPAQRLTAPAPRETWPWEGRDGELVAPNGQPLSDDMVISCLTFKLSSTSGLCRSVVCRTIP